MGDEPQKYVTRKMEILRHIDSTMPEIRKVQELTRGLPYEIQIPMVLQTVTTCDQFLRKLRQLSETHFLYSRQSPKSFDYFQSPSSYSPSNVTMAKFQSTQAQKIFNQNVRTPDNVPICFFCQKPGHVKKFCRFFLSSVPSQQNIRPQIYNAQRNPARFAENINVSPRFQPQTMGSITNNIPSLFDNLEQSMPVFSSHKYQNQGNE